MATFYVNATGFDTDKSLGVMVWRNERVTVLFHVEEGGRHFFKSSNGNWSERFIKKYSKDKRFSMYWLGEIDKYFHLKLVLNNIKITDNGTYVICDGYSTLCYSWILFVLGKSKFMNMLHNHVLVILVYM